MFKCDCNLSLSYESEIGRFTIESARKEAHVCRLILETQVGEKIELGYYCSITDVISAISQQETGYTAWDQIEAHKLPHSVHNIASWNFTQNTGTLQRAVCS
jgi:predicted SpoU family rRNA methylase